MYVYMLKMCPGSYVPIHVEMITFIIFFADFSHCISDLLFNLTISYKIANTALIVNGPNIHLFFWMLLKLATLSSAVNLYKCVNYHVINYLFISVQIVCPSVHFGWAEFDKSGLFISSL